MTRTAWTASVAAGALLIPSLASAQTIFTTDVTAGVGYSAQPFVGRSDGTRGSGGSAFYETAIQPRLELRGTHTFAVTGHASLQDYFSEYRSSDSYGAGLSYQLMGSERLKVDAQLDYDNSILGSGGNFGGPVGGGDTTGPGGGTPLPSPGPSLDPGATLPPDLGLFGTGSRRTLIQASGNVSYGLSTRDAVTVSAYYTDSSYSGAIFNQGDFSGFGGTIGYRRTVSNFLSLGLEGSANRNRFSSPRGTSEVRSAQGTFNWRPSDRWTLSGGIGVTFFDGPRTGGTGTGRALAGNFRICRKGERDNLCAGASRSAAPTAFAGTQVQTSVNASYTRQIGPASDLQFSADYTKNDADQSALLPGVGGDFITVNAGYSRRLSQRLKATAGIFYRDVSNGLGLGTDYGGRIGLGYTFGDAQ